MFLHPDEHVLPGESIVHPFSIDDLKMMEDVGIKTIYVTHIFYWDKILRQDGQLDWSSSDKRIEKYLHTDLKMILPFYVTMPRWFPPAFYTDNTSKLDTHVIPNYSNEALNRIDWRIRKFIHKCLI